MSYSFDDRQKPQAEKGMQCPLHKKDVSEVCHTCDWYRPSQEGMLDPRTKQVAGVHTKWRCGLMHLLKTFHDYGSLLEGVQAATESRGNAIAARLDVVAEDAMTIAETAREVARSGGVRIGPMRGETQQRIGGAVKMLEDKK